MFSEDRLRRWLEDLWYSTRRPPLWLGALAGLYAGASRLRAALYRGGWLPVSRSCCPVIVVGNISLGGTGKTPLVLWLYRWLEARGLRPGVISRGYGGRGNTRPRRVYADSDVAVTGDEALLLARRGVQRMAVSPRRVAAARALLADGGANVLIADDGLQHYRLGRDLEIAVVDGERRFGNGRLIPAGPLREPVSRLKTVDLVVCNGVPEPGEFAMRLQSDWAEPVGRRSDQTPRNLDSFGIRPVHGVAGIGHPQRFFAMLRSHGLEVIEHPFPDHHAFSATDVSFDDELPVLMTEKDAVKCMQFDNDKLWHVPVSAVLDDSFEVALENSLSAVLR